MGHEDAQLWVTLGDVFTRAHSQIQTLWLQFLDSLSLSLSVHSVQCVETEWMNDPERQMKSSSGTASGPTISLLTVRPQLHPTTVFVQWNLAWWFPALDSWTGCQHKLWSPGGSRGGRQWQRCGKTTTWDKEERERWKERWLWEYGLLFGDAEIKKDETQRLQQRKHTPALFV